MKKLSQITVLIGAIVGAIGVAAAIIEGLYPQAALYTALSGAYLLIYKVGRYE